MAVVAPTLMTTEEMLALPDNGMERWLIRGRLRERPWQVKDRFHAAVMARLGHVLGDWNEQRPSLAGDVLALVDCRLRRDPDSTVRIDVALAGKEMPDEAGLLAGPPSLAVEILEPRDTVGEMDEKIDEYLAAGVRVIWVIRPHRRTIEIVRPGRDPEFVTASQELSGDPELPGFRVAVARLFP
jgi:Uma2 family endonuclease